MFSPSTSTKLYMSLAITMATSMPNHSKLIAKPASNQWQTPLITLKAFYSYYSKIEPCSPSHRNKLRPPTK